MHLISTLLSILLLPILCHCAATTYDEISVEMMPKCSGDRVSFGHISPVRSYLAFRGTSFLLRTPTGKGCVKYRNAESLRLSGWQNSVQKTIFVLHGFHEYIDEREFVWVQALQKALVNRCQCNVIAVGWDASAMYIGYHAKAKAMVRRMGDELAMMIEWLVNYGANYKDVHLIGFSLGAHASGHAGRRLRDKDGRPLIGRITALDPAGPQFENSDNFHRVDTSDAKFVDVIHTDGGPGEFTYRPNNFGTYKPVGHIDFYPNGGTNQPNCNFALSKIPKMKKFVKCDHYMAVHLFLASVMHPGQFFGLMCNSYDEFFKGRCGTCSSTVCAPFGYDAVPQDQPAGTKFYLTTNGNSPYKGSNGIIRVALFGLPISAEASIELKIEFPNGKSSEIYRVSSNQLIGSEVSRVIWSYSGVIEILTKLWMRIRTNAMITRAEVRMENLAEKSEEMRFCSGVNLVTETFFELNALLC